MVKMTQSLSHWLWTNHRDIFGLVCLGHVELITDEMWASYIAWCETDEGKQYLEGGERWRESLP